MRRWGLLTTTLPPNAPAWRASALRLRRPTPAGARLPAPARRDASYGGSVALLIRSVDGGTVNYTVLQVDESLEQPQADAFIRTHMPNGKTIARFASRENALARAFELCPAPS